MPDQAAIATTFAVLGAICWSVQIIPQIILNHLRHSTHGLSGSMMGLWAFAGVPLGVYNINQGLNIGLQVQPQSFMFFATICVVQTLHYRKKWSYLRSISVITVILALFAGLETMGIELLKLQNDGWGSTFVGVLSAVLINIGLVPQFWEIYKLGAVVGVSYTFLAIDTAGAVFSFISLFFDNGGQFNILAGVSYGLLALEEVVVFALGGYFYLVNRRKVDEKDSASDLEPGTVKNDMEPVMTSPRLAPRDSNQSSPPAFP